MSYKQSVFKVAQMLPVKKGCFLVTGATGLIGGCIIDVLVEANKQGAEFIIYGMSRSEVRIKERFGNEIYPIVQNVSEPIISPDKFDYIVHCASNADPRSYAMQPVETILTNIIGCKNILEYCKQNISTKMIFTSSFEVYGQLDGISCYKENMSGIIDQTILRNGYSESKRCCELLLRSYVDEYDVNAVIARLPSVYGSTMLRNDSKAHAQFLKNALNKEDIVMKSEGKQIRTYCYVVDVVSALFTILFKGIKGEIYNVSNEDSVASIAEVAKTCAEIAGTKVIFDLPDEIEKKGFSRTLNCVLDNTKLKAMGWNGQYTLYDGLKETIETMRDEWQ